MENNVLQKRWVQGSNVVVDDLRGTMFTGEIGAHTFLVSGVGSAQETVPITGTITGRFLAANNVSIPLEGSVADGVASLTLTEDCYIIPGRFVLSIYATNGGVKQCIYCGVGNVFRTQSDIIEYPSASIPDIEQIIADAQAAVTEINADVAAAQAAVAAAQTAVDGIEDQRQTMIASIASVAGQGTDTTLTQSGVAADAKATGDEVSALKSAFGEVAEYHAPTNLYNKNSALNRTNYMVQASGDYVSLNGAQASHPIKVELGKTYTFKYSAGWFGVSNNRIVRFCDAEGNLDTGSGRFWNATDNGTASGTFTVTEDVGYVCVNVRASDAGVMVFAEGSTLPSYSDYFEPYYEIKASALPENLPLPANAQNNILYGKKAAFTGDSICYGAGSTGGYAAIIGTNNNMTVSNIAVSGGTICSGTTTSGGSARFCISASVDNMPENYDYYIVEGGVNDADASTGATLGTISSGYTATLDTTNMCGAMESLCKKLQTNFPGKKYGFIFPHNVYGDTSVWNTGWRTEMKKCLNKWGIPYLDLSDECAQLRNIDALRVYTANSDGWHPTEDGYKLYYVPKIEAWLKTL